MINNILFFFIFNFIFLSNYSNNRITISINNQSELEKAIISLEKTGGIIEIMSDLQISKNIYIPNRITLQFINNYKMIVDGNSKLEIKGKIIANQNLIFDIPLKHNLVIYNENVIPEWFGLCSHQYSNIPHDDSEIIQKAINSISVGGVIQFLGDFYGIDKTIIIPEKKKGIIITGIGAYFSSDSMSNYIKALNNVEIFKIESFGVRIKDLNFIGTNSTKKGINSTGIGLYFERKSGMKDIDGSVINCMFRDLKFAIYAKGANLKIVDNTFTFCYTGIQIDKVDGNRHDEDFEVNENEANTRGFIIDRNRFHSIGGISNDYFLKNATCIKISTYEGYTEYSGIKGLNWTVYGYYNHITDNYADDCKTFFEGSIDRTKIEGNSIFKAGSTAIKAFAGAYGTISNNMIDSSRNWNPHNLYPYHSEDDSIIGFPDGHGIHINNANFLTIHNNQILNVRYHGIYIERSKNSSIQSNTIMNFNYHRFIKKSGEPIELNDPIMWDGIHVKKTQDKYNINNSIINNHISMPFNLIGDYPEEKNSKDVGIHGRYGIYIGDGDSYGFVNRNSVLKTRLRKAIVIDN